MTAAERAALIAAGIDPDTVGPGHFEYPNYEEIARADPQYIAELSETGRLSAGEAAALREEGNTVQALVALFGDPSQVGGPGWQEWLARNPDLAKFITPEAIAAGKNNQFSTLAQIMLGHNRADAGAAAGLAGRGILASGAYAGALRRDQEKADLASYSGLQDFFGKVGQAGKDYTTAFQGFEAQRNPIWESINARLRQQFPGKWVSDPEATPPPGPGPEPGPGPPPTPTPNPYGDNPSNYGGVGSGYVPGDEPGQEYPYVAFPPNLITPPQHNLPRAPRPRKSFRSVPSSIGSYIR
jgi:hypothetical protein